MPKLLCVLASPDAELLRIGAELDKVDADRRALLEAEARRRAAQKAACHAVGLHRPAPGAGRDAWAVYERRLAMVPYDGKDADLADCNERGESIAANVIDDRQFDLLDRAAAIDATTVDGLRVQLRALQLALRDMVDERVENLLAAAMAFAGVPHRRPPPGAA